jgi:3-oxoacyl-ACP reductase-like protein
LGLSCAFTEFFQANTAYHGETFLSGGVLPQFILSNCYLFFTIHQSNSSSIAIRRTLKLANMPMHKGWLPREGTVTIASQYCSSQGKLTCPLLTLGFTSDPLGSFIKKTALNPAFTLIFLLLARYTKRGNDLSILHETAFSRLRKLFYFGVVRLVSNYLERGVLNNWTDDKYDWDKEIVLITGGAGGIGGQVVKLLAERGIKVVVLDVIPMTFEARMAFPLSSLRYAAS